MVIKNTTDLDTEWLRKAIQFCCVCTSIPVAGIKLVEVRNVLKTTSCHGRVYTPSMRIVLRVSTYDGPREWINADVCIKLHNRKEMVIYLLGHELEHLTDYLATGLLDTSPQTETRCNLKALICVGEYRAKENVFRW